MAQWMSNLFSVPLIMMVKVKDHYFSKLVVFEFIGFRKNFCVLIAGIKMLY